ncbi:MAG: Rpn family recombination-promoting nuclease/putative transposase, partial [Synergistaceae bacterium]|nr:Rpn family recombination-promoting nuclease/putative transposase [Synergistaceae bacterium]
MPAGRGISYLPLKSDVVFKMVFGDPRYSDVLRAFLISILDIPAGEFEGLQIIDPHVERDAARDKLSILDVRVELRSKKLISVEVQVRETPSMAERVAFSTARNLSRQISRGQGYDRIEKVITIVLANYDMIESDNRYHHIFRLHDAGNKVTFTDIMEIHVLELRKLPERAAKVVTDKEKELLSWLKLIRSEQREEIEMLAATTPEMGKAVGRLKRLSEDERSRLLYEARELALMDEMARINKGRADGRAEGQLEMA